MPISVNNFDRFRRDMAAEQKRRLSRAAIVVNRHAKQLLSVSGTGVIDSTGQLVRAVKRTRKTVYGAFPSRPGEPPRKQTGRGRASVTWELVRSDVEMVARVGTNVKYMRWLQIGTPRIKPRPWLDRALKEMAPTVKAVLVSPWNWRA